MRPRRVLGAFLRSLPQQPHELLRGRESSLSSMTGIWCEEPSSSGLGLFRRLGQGGHGWDAGIRARGEELRHAAIKDLGPGIESYWI